jgi:hypothetical protein
MENKYRTPWIVKKGNRPFVASYDGTPVAFYQSTLERITQCVNACAGMDDPVMEVHRLKNKVAAAMLEDKPRSAKAGNSDTPYFMTIHATPSALRGRRSAAVESLYTSSLENLQEAIEEAKADGFDIGFSSQMVYAHKDHDGKPLKVFIDGREHIVPRRPGSVEPATPLSWHELGILPPVGTVCEIVIDGEVKDFVGELNGISCKIIAHEILPSGEDVAVFSYDANQFGFQRKYHSLVASCFRPTQTEKQKTIAAMLPIVAALDGSQARAEIACEKIYDKFLADKKEK